MRLITYCFLIFFIFVTCGADDEPVLDLLIKMKTDMDECSKETGATKDDARYIWNGTISTSPAGDCLLACVMKRIGSMTSDNKINIDKEKEIAKKLPNYSDKLDKVFDQCKIDEKKDVQNGCDAAKNYWNCIIKYKDQFGISKVF